MNFNFSYHTDQHIKQRFSEIERKYPTIANFEANENEVAMEFPSLTVTSDVSQTFLSFFLLRFHSYIVIMLSFTCQNLDCSTTRNEIARIGIGLLL